MILPASYANGFAPRDGQPRHPGLWRGCVGAWAPCLGPTGLTLREWSGRGNHGTLTNMAAASDWITSGGRYGIDCDGSDDEVRADRQIETITGDMFCCAWFTPNSLAADAAIVTTRNVLTGGSRNGFALYWRDGGGGGAQNVAFEVVHSGTRHTAIHTITLAIGTRYFIYGYRRSGSVFAGVLGDGETVAGTTSTSSVTHEVSPTIGGFRDWNHVPGVLNDIAIYTRSLSPQEIRLRGSRPGIAYELAPRRISSSAVQFNRRRRLLLGASS